MKERSKVSVTDKKELYEGALAIADWIATHAGYDVRAGLEFSKTENGMARVITVFCEARHRGSDPATPPLYKVGGPYPSDGFASIDALVLQMLYRLDELLTHGLP